MSLYSDLLRFPRPKSTPLVILPGTLDQIKVIISDCHLSGGQIFEGALNPHEDFHFDDEMSEFFRYFSTGEYGEKDGKPVDVELFINGDFFDFLNVPYHGEFEDVITEDIALYKAKAIIEGHPQVMAGIREFASKPGKRVTYMIGNHDADLFFPKVRELIIRTWDPEGRAESDKVQLLADRDHVRWDGGVEVHHGNQFEAVHVLNFQKPLLEAFNDQPVLNIPWGSFYVLKIVNRLKSEREYLDKVRPIRLFIILGLLTDPWFTIRYMFLTSFYFLKTRFVYSPKRRSSIRVTAKILKEQSGTMLLDLENEARQLLNENPEVKTVIFGHTHKPMNRIWPDGKQYINTGTWTKMVNLDFRNLGRQYALTFALVKIKDGVARCDLRQWQGDTGPHRVFH
jgi:UDP-2,3-diacylglucosamine pyrophosphatase LpxH